MRKLKLLSLLMFLTLTCVTANATVMAEAPEITQPQPKHHKKPHHKKKHHDVRPPKHHPRPRPHKHRPAGVVIHHGHRPYIYSHGRYYCDRGGTYVLVKPSIGMIVPSLPSGYIRVERPHGGIGYAFGGVVYEKILSNGIFKFKIVGFL